MILRSILFAAAALVFGAGLGFAAPAPDASAAPAAGAKKISLAAQRRKLLAWDARCQAGTFDFRKIRGSDLIATPEEVLALACVSLVLSGEGAIRLSGNAALDAQAQRLAGNAAGIGDALSGGDDATGKRCRLLSGHGAQSALSATDRQRCDLLVSVLRQKQGGDALCRRARAQGIADRDFGCSPSLRFVDGRPESCGSEAGAEPRDSLMECRELAGLVAALRSQDPKQCSAAPFCSVLAQRDARACAEYLKRANRSFCERIGPSLAQLRSLEKESLQGFKSGQPMQAIPPDVDKRMKEIEAAGRKGK